MVDKPENRKSLTSIKISQKTHEAIKSVQYDDWKQTRQERTIPEIIDAAVRHYAKSGSQTRAHQNLTKREKINFDGGAKSAIISAEPTRLTAIINRLTSSGDSRLMQMAETVLEALYLYSQPEDRIEDGKNNPDSKRPETNAGFERFVDQSHGVDRHTRESLEAALDDAIEDADERLEEVKRTRRRDEVRTKKGA